MIKLEKQSQDDNGHDQDQVKIIIINGREKNWSEEYITFSQVVNLAFENYVDSGNTVYTVTYKRGHGNKPEGSLVNGESVKVKDKMIFNVTATDKS